MRMLALALSLAVPFAHASCIDEAKDRQAFNECAQREILPLEARVVQLVNTVRNGYRSDAELLKRFETSADAWNAYRNSHCAIEASGSGGEIERQRTFARCTLRMLSARMAELESLAGMRRQ